MTVNSVVFNFSYFHLFLYLMQTTYDWTKYKSISVNFTQENFKDFQKIQKNL